MKTKYYMQNQSMFLKMNKIKFTIPLLLSFVVLSISFYLIFKFDSKAQADYPDFRIEMKASSESWGIVKEGPTMSTPNMSVGGGPLLNWVSDEENGTNPEYLQLNLVSNAGIIAGKDFRLGFQARENGYPDGTIQYTKWASEGGGWSNLALASNGVGGFIEKPDEYRLILDVRDLPAGNLNINNFRIGIKGTMNYLNPGWGSPTRTGVARFTPWLKDGGGWLDDWADGGCIGPCTPADGYQIYIDIDSPFENDFRIGLQGDNDFGDPGEVAYTPWVNLLNQRVNKKAVTDWALSRGGGDPDFYRLHLDTKSNIIPQIDFRIGLQTADDLGLNNIENTKYTRWASEGGGWTWYEDIGGATGVDNTLVSRDNMRLYIETRDMPAGRSITGFRMGLIEVGAGYVYADENDIPTPFSGTPSSSNGGGFSNYWIEDQSPGFILEMESNSANDFRIGLQAIAGCNTHFPDCFQPSAGTIFYTPWASTIPVNLNIGWSNWATDTNSHDPDAFKVFLDTIGTPDYNFQIAFQSANGNSSIGWFNKISTTQYTELLSNGGGWTPWTAANVPDIDPNAYRIGVKKYPWPAGMSFENDIKDFRFGIQAEDGYQGGGSQFGQMQFTDWALNGRSESEWAYDSSRFGPDAFRIKLEISPYSPLRGLLPSIEKTGPVSVNAGDDMDYTIEYKAKEFTVQSGFKPTRIDYSGPQYVPFDNSFPYSPAEYPIAVTLSRNLFHSSPGEEMVIINENEGGIDQNGFYYTGDATNWECINPGNGGPVDAIDYNTCPPGKERNGVWWIAVQGNIPGKIYSGFHPIEDGRRVWFPAPFPDGTTPNVIIAKNTFSQGWQMLGVYDTNNNWFRFGGSDYLNNREGDLTKYINGDPLKRLAGIYWIAVDGNLDLNNDGEFEIQSGFNQNQPQPPGSPYVGNNPKQACFDLNSGPPNCPATFNNSPTVVASRNWCRDGEQNHSVYNVSANSFWYQGDALDWSGIYNIFTRENNPIGVYWVAVDDTTPLNITIDIEDEIPPGTTYLSDTAPVPKEPGIIRWNNLPQGDHIFFLKINVPQSICTEPEVTIINKVYLYYGAEDPITAQWDTEVICDQYIIGDIHAFKNIDIDSDATGIVTAGGFIISLTSDILLKPGYTINQETTANFSEKARIVFNQKNLKRLNQRAKPCSSNITNLKPSPPDDDSPEGGVWEIDTLTIGDPISDSTKLYNGRGTIIVKNGLNIYDNIKVSGSQSAVGFIVLDGDVFIGSKAENIEAAIFAPNGTITIEAGNPGVFKGLFVAKQITIDRSMYIIYNEKIASYQDTIKKILYHPLPGFGQLIAPIQKEVAF